MNHRYTPTLILLAGCASVALLPLSGCDQFGSARSNVKPDTVVNAPPAAGVQPARSDSKPEANINFVRTVAAKVEPAVVTVHVMAAIERQPLSVQDLMLGRGGTEVRRGAGSGVIISPDGYIVTNDHVVAGAQRVTVEVGGTGYDARVIGTDLLSDIAVVKVDPPNGAPLPVAQMGDSDAVRVGDWAIAVGNPLDIGATVTLGIVSAIGPRGPHLQGDAASTVLQTDAAINPGNSGGALADSDGKVIGINEAILSPTGSFIGIGFAIPINAARKIAEQLVAHGRVIRPYLGISYVPVKSIPPQVRARAGMNTTLTSGVVVTDVAPNTPAAAAALRPGDVLLQADGKALEDEHALNEIIGSHNVGDTLRLQIERRGRTQTLSVTLRERPTTFGVPPSARLPRR